MLRLQLILLFLIHLLLLSSCSQLSSLQTGRTLGKNNKQIGAFTTIYGLHEDISSGGELGSLVLPHEAIWGQYGVTEKLDLGIKVSTGANISLLGKYQIVGDQSSNWAISLGGNAEYQFAGTENLVFRTHLPLYISYHPQDQWGIYATPRYIYQSVSNDAATHFGGSAIGVQRQFNERWYGILEGSYFKPFSPNKDFNNARIFQAGVGFQYRF